MAYDWKSLERWLLADLECKCCDNKTLKAEVQAIISAAKSAYRSRSSGEGCISCSLRLMRALMVALPKATVASGTVRGANVFRTTTTRTWIRIETDCYVIEPVARWSWFFRHQAVAFFPKCNPDPYNWWGSTVIDIWWGVSGVWRSWHNWAGGAGEVGRTAGRVRDKF